MLTDLIEECAHRLLSSVNLMCDNLPITALEFSNVPPKNGRSLTTPGRFTQASFNMCRVAFACPAGTASERIVLIRMLVLAVDVVVLVVAGRGTDAADSVVYISDMSIDGFDNDGDSGIDGY